MAVITPPEIATEAGAVPSGVTTRVLRTTRSARTMAGETIRRQAQESPGREAPVVRCGNPVTSRRNTRAVCESLCFSDSVGFAHEPRKGHAPKSGAACGVRTAMRLLWLASVLRLIACRRAVRSALTLEGAGSRERGAVKEGRKRIIRIVVAALGLTALLALQPESDRLVESAWARSGGRTARAPIVRRLILSDQARRYLALQYRSYPTEFMGCMIGEARGSAVLVRRIAPADVEPSHSTATRVVPHQTCEDAGWSGTVGVIHSHPGGELCWYYFPTTQVASSDGQSFASQPYPVDAIMCGDHVVWINRNMAETQLPLAAER